MASQAGRNSEHLCACRAYNFHHHTRLTYGAPWGPLAIWQFTFHLIPGEAVEQFHGPTALRPIEIETNNENAESPNYWAGRSPRSYAKAVEPLLPARNSWSADALMFGDEEGDGIELWDDDVRVRSVNECLARAIVSMAAANDLTTSKCQSPLSLASFPSASVAPSSLARSYQLRALARSGSTPCTPKRCSSAGS